MKRIAKPSPERAKASQSQEVESVGHSASSSSQRGRGVLHRGALLLNTSQKFSEIFTGSQRV